MVNLNNPDELRDFIVESLDNGKAEDIVTIDLSGKTDLADYMVVVTGTSGRHVTALANNLMQKLKDEGIKNVSAEGMTDAKWVLLDANDVIVNIMQHESRGLYDLEDMWKMSIQQSENKD
jgi:ribosome-associated protein